jgi:hypothetical protein
LAESVRLVDVHDTGKQFLGVRYLVPEGCKYRPKFQVQRLDYPVPIARCDVCVEIADKAFDGGSPQAFQEIAGTFLNHVLEKHTSELLGLLAERYGPIFLAKRELR